MNTNGLSPWGLFQKSFEKYGENVMVIYNDTRYTYNQIHSRIIEFAERTGKLDFIAAGIFLPNCTEFITSLLSLNMSGKIVVPLSYQLKGESLYERINYSDIEVIITDKKGFDEISLIRDKINIREAIVMQETGEYTIQSMGTAKPKERILDENTFGICFTGGSTSKPKGVVLSNFAVSGNALAVAEVLDFKSNDVFLMARPFTQAGPIASDILMTISCGGGIVILNDLYHPGIFLKAIEDYRVSTTYLVRTVLSQILDYRQLPQFDVSSLRRVILGAMITPESVIRDAAKKLPKVNLYNAYGLSEASVRVSFLMPHEMLKYPGSVGKPIRGCSVKILNDNGREQPPCEIGEVYVSTDYVMDGYYKYPDLTSNALTDKGLRTKDKGYVDENGMLYIVGRADDLIIQGGNNVYPVEIEEVLLRNPSVSEAVVLGIEDEKLGQRIVALVRPAPGSSITQQELYRWCRANLEDRKIPREICIVDRVPRNEMGKINKSELKAFYLKLKNNGGQN